MIGWIIGGAVALYLLSSQQKQSSGSTSGTQTTVGTNPPAFGNVPSSVGQVARESQPPTDFLLWQNGPFVPVPPGSAQDIIAQGAAQSDSKISQLQGITVINPTPIVAPVGGNISAGTPSGTGGSGGTSGGSQGGGFILHCPIKGTAVEAVGGGAMNIVEMEETEWIVIYCDNGCTLMASESHQIYTARGLMPLEVVTVHDFAVTRLGESKITRIERKSLKGIKLAIEVPDGHVYWAGGILSHNKQNLVTP